MGCDGGTIPKRDELVRTKKKQEACPKEVKNAAKWNYCHLSQVPLQKPVVGDLLGNLYNKEAIIEHLLDKSKYEKAPEHLKGLKDVKELSLVVNPSYDSNKQEKGDENSSMGSSKWICPITGLEMSGNFKFYFLFSCGCVFSERAFKQMGMDKKKCIKCEKSFGENDLIIINPSEEELVLNEVKMKARKEAASKAKAEKSSSKSSSSASASEATTSSKTSSSYSSALNGDKVKQKRSVDDSKDHSNSSKKVKSIQDDPETSDVYKSLFNTHEKAKNQTKAHWVTYNPFFN